jgi:hypothetical protein
MSANSLTLRCLIHCDTRPNTHTAGGGSNYSQVHHEVFGFIIKHYCSHCGALCANKFSLHSAMFDCLFFFPSHACLYACNTCLYIIMVPSPAAFPSGLLAYDPHNPRIGIADRFLALSAAIRCVSVCVCVMCWGRIILTTFVFNGRTEELYHSLSLTPQIYIYTILNTHPTTALCYVS